MFTVTGSAIYNPNNLKEPALLKIENFLEAQGISKKSKILKIKDWLKEKNSLKIQGEPIKWLGVAGQKPTTGIKFEIVGSKVISTFVKIEPDK